MPFTSPGTAIARPPGERMKIVNSKIDTIIESTIDDKSVVKLNRLQSKASDELYFALIIM